MLVHTHPVDVLRRICPIHDRQPVLIWHADAAKVDAVDNAEHRRTKPDPEPESHDGYSGRTGSLEDGPQA